MKIDIKGLDELKAMKANFDATLGQMIVDVVTPLTPIADLKFQNAGREAYSWEIDVSDPGHIVVGNVTDYAFFCELGTRKMKAFNMMGQTVDIIPEMLEQLLGRF